MTVQPLRFTRMLPSVPWMAVPLPELNICSGLAVRLSYDPMNPG